MVESVTPETGAQVCDGVGVGVELAIDALWEFPQADKPSADTRAMAATAETFTDEWCAIDLEKRTAGVELSLDTRCVISLELANNLAGCVFNELATGCLGIWN